MASSNNKTSARRVRLPLVQEQVRVGKRRRATGKVRVRTVVDETKEIASGTLQEEHAEVTRIPRGLFHPAPAIGATSIAATADWNVTDSTYLPDATKGDVSWVYQRGPRTVGSGANAATYFTNVRYAKLTDLTLTDGAGGTISAAPMNTVPLTGSFSTDWRFSQFAALASSVNPSAAPTDPAVSAPAPGVIPVAYSLTFPDSPFNGALARSTFFNVVPSATTDLNYGPIPYGQFLDSIWHEVVQLLYSYDIPLTAARVKAAIGV